MAEDLAQLMKALGLMPELAIGHSAGAAILAQMCLNKYLDINCLISLNGALVPLSDARGDYFSPMAKFLSMVPYTPALFSTMAGNERSVRRLLAATGSEIDEVAVRLYTKLVATTAHVDSALAMMSNWDLPGFAARLPGLDVSTYLWTGGNDQTVPPEDSMRASRVITDSQVQIFPGLGHLAHEEAPDLIVGHILEVAKNCGQATARDVG